MGLAFAQRFAAEGAALILADVDDGALARAASALRAQGATYTAYRVDLARSMRGWTC
jgi:3-oxoacyl-[acyl-carrier protein] reductase